MKPWASIPQMWALDHQALDAWVLLGHSELWEHVREGPSPLPRHKQASNLALNGDRRGQRAKGASRPVNSGPRKQWWLTEISDQLGEVIRDKRQRATLMMARQTKTTKRDAHRGSVPNNRAPKCVRWKVDNGRSSKPTIPVGNFNTCLPQMARSLKRNQRGAQLTWMMLSPRWVQWTARDHSPQREQTSRSSHSHETGTRSHSGP